MPSPIQSVPKITPAPNGGISFEAVTGVRASSTSEEEGSAQARPSHSEIPIPGTVLDGRYVVDSILGEGGMGVVCVGRHLELGQRVAIKFLRSDMSKRPNVTTRFLDEGRAAASLHSEHVVKVMDVGQLDSGIPYLVMEHLEGTDLEALAETTGPLDVDSALDYVMQVCSALSEAHASQLIHRDIKPENLFLVESAGRTLVKVLDFGLAKRINSSRLRLTGPQDSIGSPFYMSPEQIVTPQQVDARTDIWSIGVVLYRFLTGRVPFQGDTLIEVFAHVINARPESIRALRPELDEELDRIVARCLEKDVGQRYQSIAEFAHDIERYNMARKRGPSVAAPPEVTEDEAPPKIAGVRSRWPAMLGVAMLSAAVVYGADRAGLVQVGSVTEPVVHSQGNSGLAHTVTFGMLRRPSLALPTDEPMPPRLLLLTPGPASGTYTIDPALDASGVADVTTIRAERERDATPSNSGDEIDPEAARERLANYRRYFEQNRVTPLKDALEPLHDDPSP